MQKSFVQKIQAIKDEFQFALRALSHERQVQAEKFRTEAENIKIEEIKQSIRS
jgi:hypothetical protein